jgi:peptidyl-tRNA hydrolase
MSDNPWVMYYVVRSAVPFSLEQTMARAGAAAVIRPGVMRAQVTVSDAGHTQVAPGTETVIALVPSPRGSRRE